VLFGSNEIFLKNFRVRLENGTRPCPAGRPGPSPGPSGAPRGSPTVKLGAGTIANRSGRKFELVKRGRIAYQLPA